MLIDVARLKFIKNVSEALEEGTYVPTNFATTVGHLFDEHAQSQTLCDLMKYLLIKFDGEMDNKGFTITGSMYRPASDIEALIFLGVHTTLRDSMPFMEPAVKLFLIVCQKKRRRATEVPAYSAVAPTLRAVLPPTIQETSKFELCSFDRFSKTNRNDIIDYTKVVNREYEALEARVLSPHL